MHKMSDDPPVAHYRQIDGNQQPLVVHLQNVVELARSFAKQIGLENQGELLGLLHDLGKYSATFQSYIQSANGLLNQDWSTLHVGSRLLKAVGHREKRQRPVCLVVAPLRDLIRTPLDPDGLSS